MFRRVGILLAVLAVVGGGLVLRSAEPAVAHEASWFDPTWTQGGTVNVYYNDDDSFWGQTKRNRITAAITTWNELNMRGDTLGPTFVWQQVSTQSAGISGTCSPNDPARIIIDAVDLPYTVYGDTDVYDWPCVYLKITHSSELPVGVSWYESNCGDSGGSNDLSLCGTLVHELGHAHGMVAGGAHGPHFPNSDDACPNNSPGTYSTMCSGADITIGQVWQLASLESHDIHTYANAYPQ